MVFTSVTVSLTSCAMSLSEVEMTVRRLAASACLAKVPITSSASTPGTMSNGMPSALIASCSGATWQRNSSGIRGRCAL